MIYLGADHRGYQLKDKLKEYLTFRGYQIMDMGTNSADAVDYPLIAKAVSEEVVKDLNNRGILLCGSAAGISIAANKIKGVRAGVAWNEKIATANRNDDNINIVCIPADDTDEETAKKIIQTFLDTSFGGEERRVRRLKQIEDIENNNLSS